MDEDERNNLNKTQSNEIYRAIGEFVVKYEQLMQQVDSAILWLLWSKGLRHQEFSAILTSKTSHSNLIQQYRAMCQSVFTLENEERIIFDSILGKLSKIAEDRNRLIHTVRFVGYGNEETEDFSKAPGIRRRIRKGELNYQTDSITANGVDELTKELNEVNKIFSSLSICLSHDFSIRRNLIINADGSVSYHTDVEK